MKILKALFIVGAVILLVPGAYAGGSSSAGGNGVRLSGGKLYLLDFVEGNIHEHPNFSNRANFSPAVVQAIQQHIQIDEATARLVSAKLLEIYDKNAVLDFLVKWRLFHLDWIFTPRNLINVNDQDGVLEFPGHTVEQVAARQGSQIFVSQEHWAELDVENRAGLILHEVMYSLSDSFLKQAHNSPSARSLTRLFFTPQFSGMSRERLLFALNRELIPLTLPDSLLGKNQIFVKRYLGAQLQWADFFFGLSNTNSNYISSSSVWEHFETPSHPSLEMSSLTPGQFLTDKHVALWAELRPLLEQIIAGNHPEYRMYTKDDVPGFARLQSPR